MKPTKEIESENVKYKNAVEEGAPFVCNGGNLSTVMKIEEDEL